MKKVEDLGEKRKKLKESKKSASQKKGGGSSSSREVVDKIAQKLQDLKVRLYFFLYLADESKLSF